MSDSNANARRANTSAPAEVDVAIVGAGLGGLVAGATLARAGRSVAVFDAHYVAGGCATHFTRGPRSKRYHFDVGVHYVGDCGAEGQIPRMLRGLDAPVEFEPLDPDGFDTLVFPDLTFRIPADVGLYRERLLGLFPDQRRGIDGYLRVLQAVMRAGRTMDANDGRIDWRAALSMARDALPLALHAEHTLAQLFDRVGVRDPRLRAVLVGQSGDYGLPPSRVSAMMHLGLAGHYFRGAYYPRGGGQRIADAIADSLERAGGTLHLRRPVARVRVESGRAVGIELTPRGGDPAETVRAKAVLSNADLKRTLLDLVGPEHLPTEWVTRTTKLEMAAALSITFLGVKGDLRDRGMRAANYWQFDGYDVEEFYRRGATGDGAALSPFGCYVTSASLKDPRHRGFHAPDGVTNVEVMTVVPPSGPAWGVSPDDAVAWRYRDNAAYRAKKQRLEDDMIARLDRLFPGAAADVVFRETATPVTHERYTRASDGTGYGLAATPAQFMKRRPGYAGPLPGPLPLRREHPRGARHRRVDDGRTPRRAAYPPRRRHAHGLTGPPKPENTGHP
jgi:all-trans-retinol 13,14-reductase